MEREYLVFWNRGAGLDRRASVVKLVVPTHENPRGHHLEDLIMIGLMQQGASEVTIFGVVELPAACWTPGLHRDLALGNGKVATLECQSGKGWRVHV